MKLKINASALESAIRQTCAGMRACPFIEQEVFVIAEQNGMQVQVVITRDEDSFIEEASGEFTVPDKPQSDSVPAGFSAVPTDWLEKLKTADGALALELVEHLQMNGLQRPEAPEGE